MNTEKQREQTEQRGLEEGKKWRGEDGQQRRKGKTELGWVIRITEKRKKFGITKMIKTDEIWRKTKCG